MVDVVIVVLGKSSYGYLETTVVVVVVDEIVVVDVAVVVIVVFGQSSYGYLETTGHSDNIPT